MMTSPEEIIAKIKNMALITPNELTDDSEAFAHGFNAALRVVRDVIESGELCVGDCNKGYGSCHQCEAASDAR
jgi:Tfp pilus assembly pilus retraction ATPase PilT